MDSVKIYFANLAQPVLVVICIALSLLVGIVDYLTGDYGITVLYILPLYISAKLLGRGGCICFTLLCNLELMGLALLNRQAGADFFDAVFWNALLQSAELGISGVLISQLAGKLCQSTRPETDS